MLRKLAPVLLLTLLACASATSPADVSTPWKVGDTVDGWRVVRADVRPDPVENGWIGEADFEGEAVISGTFQPHPDAEFGALCFFADESERTKLPRFPNDVRRPWFCFTNEDEVRRAASAGDRVRIRVAKFLYMYSHTDVYNRVELVEVMR